MRNDFYVRIGRAELERGKKTSSRNVEVEVLVCNKEGAEVRLIACSFFSFFFNIPVDAHVTLYISPEIPTHVSIYIFVFVRLRRWMGTVLFIFLSLSLSICGTGILHCDTGRMSFLLSRFLCG